MHSINNPTQIGATLTGRRKHLKLSQTDVANRLGLSQNRISELEAKPETLTVEQLLALLVAKTPRVIEEVSRGFPRGFPQALLDRVLDGLRKSAQLLTRA